MWATGIVSRVRAAGYRIWRGRKMDDTGGKQYGERDSVTEVEYFTRIARCGEGAVVDAIDGGDATDPADETDGITDIEGKPLALDATLPFMVAPDWCMSNVPVSDSQGRRISESNVRLSAFPVDDADWMKLKEAEEKVLAGISGYTEKFDVKIFDVEIVSGVKVHTVHFRIKSSCTSQPPQPPVVLLHGTGGGIPCFHKICGQLMSQYQNVYAIDVPGFGLSSRIKFSNNVDICEDQLVHIMEVWREKMSLDIMILMGHSFGAYVCAIYTIKHYKYVCHLVLMDSWGVLPEEELKNTSSQSLLYKFARAFCEKFKANPVKYFPSFGHALGSVVVNIYMTEKEKKCYGTQCMEYIRRATTTGEMSGMKALLVLSGFKIDYPLRPLKKRLIDRLRSVDLPVTFIYGNDSPYKNLGGDDVKSQAKEHLVNVECVDGSGHHVHVENPDRLVEIMRQLTKGRTS